MGIINGFFDAYKTRRGNNVLLAKTCRLDFAIVFRACTKKNYKRTETDSVRQMFFYYGQKLSVYAINLFIGRVFYRPSSSPPRQVHNTVVNVQIVFVFYSFRPPTRLINMPRRHGGEQTRLNRILKYVSNTNRAHNTTRPLRNYAFTCICTRAYIYTYGH